MIRHSRLTCWRAGSCGRTSGPSLYWVRLPRFATLAPVPWRVLRLHACRAPKIAVPTRTMVASFFDGSLVIVAHAHRQVTKRWRRRRPSATSAIAELAKAREPRPRLFRVVAPGRKQHQPGEPDVPCRRDRPARSALPRPAARRTSSPRPRSRPGPARRAARFPSAALPPLRRAAASSSTESTDWMHANAAAAFFALFDCRWPMRCHLAGISAVSAIFCRPSCTLFSPNSRCPASHASRTQSAPNVFETATSVTSDGRPSGPLGPPRRSVRGPPPVAWRWTWIRFRVQGSTVSEPRTD